MSPRPYIQKKTVSYPLKVSLLIVDSSQLVRAAMTTLTFITFLLLDIFSTSEWSPNRHSLIKVPLSQTIYSCSNTFFKNINIPKLHVKKFCVTSLMCFPVFDNVTNPPQSLSVKQSSDFYILPLDSCSDWITVGLKEMFFKPRVCCHLCFLEPQNAWFWLDFQAWT